MSRFAAAHRLLRLALFASVALGAGCATGAVVEELHEPAVTPPPAPAPTPPGPPEEWQVDYEGFGRVVVDDDGAVLLEPRSPGAPGETHAALARMRSTIERPVRDFVLTVEVLLEKQLRVGSQPNSWESAWLFFNYTGQPGDKMTNYLAFKTDGVELGRAWSERKQEFLHTRPWPRLRPGKPAIWTIRKRGQVIEVSHDGHGVFRFRGGRMPHGIYDVPGAIGVYAEDARVRVRALALSLL